MGDGERKYALIRLAKGDYLLMSNDAKRLWRISAYHEDGSAGLVGRYWGVWLYKRSFTSGGEVRTDDWNDFEMQDALMPTRKYAVSWTLSH